MSNQTFLHLRYLSDAFIQSDLQKVHLSEERETIYLCWYSRIAHRTKCQAPVSEIPQILLKMQYHIGV